MASPTDRKEIKKLHGQADPSVWHKAPTYITLPQNPARSGANPYGKPSQPTQRGSAKGQRSSSSVGNPTSRQTLAGRREPKEPPNKRQKVSHGGAGFSGGQGLSKVLRQSEEVILVDDDSEEQQKKRSAQYLLSGGSRRTAKQTIRPSGKNTAYLDKFLDVESPVDLTADSDDNITSPPDSPIPPSDLRLQGHRIDSGSNVKTMVASYEAKAAPPQAEEKPPRIDLRTIPRGKNRMQPKLVPSKSPGTKAAGPSTVPKGLDPIATSSSLKPKPKSSSQSLPVREALIDAKYYGGEDSQLFVTYFPKGGLSLMKRQNGSTGTPEMLYDVSLEQIPDMQLKYGPTILQFSNKVKEGLVTMRFEEGGPGWSVEKKDEVTTLMRGLDADLSTPSNQEVLWAAAQQHKGALLQEVPSITEPKSDRMEELKVIEERKLRNLCRPPQSDNPESIQSTFAKRRETEPNSIPLTPALPSTSVPENNRKNTTRSSKKNEPQIPEALTAVRRSTRNKERESEERAPDADEIMLVYPPGAPGAVTITKGDFTRLEPGQYLNDTLIEFALKLWMTRLEQERPDIAQHVHVFSSFFYKKLNSKRDMRQAYENVRKWTSKFDIFKKKYIVVPINEHYHWYLAIIYEPEHMLSETTPEKPTARKATRLATKAVEAEIADALMQSEEDMDVLEETGDKLDVNVEEDKAEDQSAEQEPSVSEAIPPTSSEGEVERDLSGFDESVRIEDPEPGEPAPKEGARSRSHSTLSYVSENLMKVSKSRAVSPSASDFGKSIPRSRRGSNASSDINMSDPDEMLLKGGDVPVELSKENVALLDKSSADVDPGSPIAVSEVASASHGGGIPPTRFYQSISKKEKGKQKAEPKRDVLSVDDDNTQDAGMDVDRKPRTVIFTFDSLGTSHRAAITKLSAYLQREAEDKKGIVNAGQAEGKQASVPAQPNFCDCGLYLIHFAQTFISDPVKYYGLSMAPKAKLHNKNAKEHWNDKVVQTMRTDLAQEIMGRSEDWLKTRPAKPQKEDSESDDEITFLPPAQGEKRKPAAAQKSGASQKPPASKKPPVSHKADVSQKLVDQKPVDPTETEHTEGPASRLR